MMDYIMGKGRLLISQCGSIRQIRFPRSKKKRIQRKWTKNYKNWNVMYPVPICKSISFSSKDLDDLGVPLYPQHKPGTESGDSIGTIVLDEVNKDNLKLISGGYSR